MPEKKTEADWTTLARKVHSAGFDGPELKRLLEAMRGYLWRVAYNADKRDPEGLACNLQYVVFRALRQWRKNSDVWMLDFEHYVKRAVRNAVIGHGICKSRMKARIIGDANELSDTFPAPAVNWHYTITDVRLIQLLRVADPIDRVVITRLERGDTPNEIARLLLVKRSSITRRIRQMRDRVTNCATKLLRGASIDVRL